MKFMRIFHTIALALPLCCYAADVTFEKKHGVEFITYPTPHYGTGDQRKLIERGEHLVVAGDCIGCHTDPKDKGKPFAGGLGLKTPFGTIYTPNITPDKETGIGKWTDKDFIRAMQKGVAPDGSHYFPAFPYTSFTKIYKNDILAIKAYLLSIPAIHKQNKPTEMPWPFSWRFLQLGWKLLFFKEGEYQYDPTQSPEWNKGAYLVQGLAHCGECHTPRNPLGGMKTPYYLTGAFIDGYFAPNITSYGIGDIPTFKVVQVFTEEKRLKGEGHIGGPMEEVDHNSLQKLSKTDLRAIVTYLKTVKSQQTPITAKTAGPVSAEAGKAIYENHCASCHTTGAAGAPILGNQTTWEPRLKQGMVLLNKHAIDGFNSMPPKGACMSCSDEEIIAAAQYLVDQSKPGATTAVVAAKTPSAPVKLSLDQGKKIYDENCSVCHTTGQLGSPKLGDAAAWRPRLQQNMDVLINHTVQGYNRMPAKGACPQCSNAELIAAIKYMAQEGNPQQDYSLW